MILKTEIKPQEVMVTFLDLSGAKKFSSELAKRIPLSEMQAKIEEDTHRKITVQYPPGLEYIGIVKYDPPVGYSIYAIKNIPKGTSLFYYGGVWKETKQARAHTKNNYALGFQNNLDYYLDAEKEGDIGSLVMHLFNQNISVDKSYLDRIDKNQLHLAQFQNINKKIIKDSNDITFKEPSKCIFFAERNIEKDEPLGFSYGMDYFLLLNESPIVMGKDGNSLNVCVKYPVIGLKNINRMGLGIEEMLTNKNEILSKYHFIKNKEKDYKLHIFSSEENLMYVNKTFLERALQSALENPSTELIKYIPVRDISAELHEALDNKQDFLYLPLSIYAKKNECGNFPDLDMPITSEMVENKSNVEFFKIPGEFLEGLKCERKKQLLENLKDFTYKIGIEKRWKISKDDQAWCYISDAEHLLLEKYNIIPASIRKTTSGEYILYIENVSKQNLIEQFPELKIELSAPYI